MGNGLEKVGKAAQLFAASAIGQKIAGFASEIAQLGITCIQSAAQMKQYEIAFTTMLNSAEAGKKMLADLKQFAASTPFDVPGVVQAGQHLHDGQRAAGMAGSRVSRHVNDVSAQLPAFER